MACVEGEHDFNLFPGIEQDAIAVYNAGEDFKATYPIGQLLKYMQMNSLSVGVLMTSRRSYFLRATLDGDGGLRVAMTKAYFLHSPRYLRVFAYVMLVAKERACEPLRWPTEEKNLQQRLHDNCRCGCGYRTRTVRTRGCRITLSSPRHSCRHEYLREKPGPVAAQTAANRRATRTIAVRYAARNRTQLAR